MVVLIWGSQNLRNLNGLVTSSFSHSIWIEIMYLLHVHFLRLAGLKVGFTCIQIENADAVTGMWFWNGMWGGLSWMLKRWI